MSRMSGALRETAYDPLSEVQERPTRSRSWLWLVVAVVVVAGVASLGGLRRFPEWDEAVFWSQSGGYEGNGSPPSFMAASRELGPPVLIWGLRQLGLSLFGVRLAWSAITIAVLLVACWRIDHHFPANSGALSAALIGTSWLFVAYAGGFYSACLAALLGMLLFALYLDMRRDQRRRWVWLWGVTASASLWMRPFETALVIVVLTIHSLAVQPQVLWKRKPPPLLAGFIITLALFGAPWIADSTIRYGGVAERLSLASGQGFALSPGFRLLPYLGYLGGAQQANNIFTEIPSWPSFILIGLIVLWLGIAGLSFSDHRVRREHGLVVAILGLVGFSFYFFIAEQLRDRYLLYGLVFLLLGVGTALARRLKKSMRLWMPLVMGSLLLWIGANLAVALPYQRARVIGATQLELTGQLLDASIDVPCRGVSRYGAPQWQLATGCRFSHASSSDEAMALIRTIVTGDAPTVVVWPATDDLPIGENDGWIVMEFPRTAERSDLVFLYGVEVAESVSAQIQQGFLVPSQ